MRRHYTIPTARVISLDIEEIASGFPIHPSKKADGSEGMTRRHDTAPTGDDTADGFKRTMWEND